MAHAATREYAMELIEKIAPEKISVAVELLEKMVDPVAWAQANAPFEDEEISAEEEASVALARLEAGKPSEQSHAEFLAEFGLTLDDWERLGTAPVAQTDESFTRG